MNELEDRFYVLYDNGRKEMNFMFKYLNLCKKQI
jgi:hypothetical protein